MARTRNMFASLLIGATLLGGGALANDAAAAPLLAPTHSMVAQSTPDASPTANRTQCGDESQETSEQDTDTVQDEINTDASQEDGSEDQGTNESKEGNSEGQDTEDTEDENSSDASDGEEQETDESDSADASEQDNEDATANEDASAMSTPGTLTQGQDLQTEASTTVDEAVTAAQGEASGTLGSVELEDREGTLVYEVTIGTQEIFVNATNGEIVASQPVDTRSADCENDSEDAPGTLTEGQDLLPQATITLDEAITAATSETTGTLGTVELQQDGDTLVYVVEVGDQEVTIDASDGHVISVDQED